MSFAPLGENGMHGHTEAGPIGTKGERGTYADHFVPEPAQYSRNDSPLTDMDHLVNAVIDAAVARGVIGPVTNQHKFTLEAIRNLTTATPPAPDYRFVFNDWREDRCSLYGPRGPIVSGLAPYQRRSLMDHFVREANHLRQRAFDLRRFAVFEVEDGVYEDRRGSYVLFKDVRDLFETPIVVDLK